MLPRNWPYDRTAHPPISILAGTLPSSDQFDCKIANIRIHFTLCYQTPRCAATIKSNNVATGLSALGSNVVFPPTIKIRGNTDRKGEWYEASRKVNVVNGVQNYISPAKSNKAGTPSPSNQTLRPRGQTIPPFYQNTQSYR